MALREPMKRKRRRTNQQTRMAATGFELMVPLVTKPRMGPNRTSLATACSTREAPIRLFRQGLKVVRRMPMVMMGFQKAKSCGNDYFYSVTVGCSKLVETVKYL